MIFSWKSVIFFLVCFLCSSLFSTSFFFFFTSSSFVVRSFTCVFFFSVFGCRFLVLKKVVFGDEPAGEGGAVAGEEGAGGAAGKGGVSAISEEAWVEPNVVADPSRGGLENWGRPERGEDEEEEEEELQLGGGTGVVCVVCVCVCVCVCVLRKHRPLEPIDQ